MLRSAFAGSKFTFRTICLVACQLELTDLQAY